MQIIGEKINGTRKQVAQAIAQRNAEFIQSLAKSQVEVGVDWLDLNAGTHPDREPDDLVWLIESVQQVVDVPLCLDSANPKALDVAIQHVHKTPLINSISAEAERLNGILPLARDYGCSVIALALDAKSVPTTIDGRMSVIRRLMKETRSVGIPDERVYVDPLVMTISTNSNHALIALDTIRAVRAEFPSAHITAGLSNVSFGLPMRGLINRTFLTLALEAGLDSAILDPLDRELRAVLITTKLLLGSDRYCQNYTRAYRTGILEPTKQHAA